MTRAEPLALLIEIVAQHIRDPCVRGFCFEPISTELNRRDEPIRWQGWRVESRRTSYRKLTNSIGEEKEKEEERGMKSKAWIEFSSSSRAGEE